MRRNTAPILLLNLDREPSRLGTAAAEFDRCGLSCQRFAATDHLDLSDADIRRATQTPKRHGYKRELSRGEIACFLSHLAMWRRIAEGSDEIAFVFEDDVRLAPAAAEVIASIEDGPIDWDILRLFSMKARPLSDMRAVDDDHQCGLVLMPPVSTVGYAITRPAARHLTQTAMPFFLPVDQFLKHWWMHGLCTRLVVPSICAPANLDHTGSGLQAGRLSMRPGGQIDRFIANLRYQIGYRQDLRAHADRFPTSRQAY